MVKRLLKCKRAGRALAWMDTTHRPRKAASWVGLSAVRVFQTDTKLVERHSDSRDPEADVEKVQDSFERRR